MLIDYCACSNHFLPQSTLFLTHASTTRATNTVSYFFILRQNKINFAYYFFCVDVADILQWHFTFYQCRWGSFMCKQFSVPKKLVLVLQHYMNLAEPPEDRFFFNETHVIF